MLLYKLVIVRITNAPMLSQIFTTFGIMFLLRGVAQFLWKPDFRSIENSRRRGSMKLLGLQLGQPQLVAGLGAVLVTGVIWYFLNHTKLGAALEATAADKDAARLMGIDSHKMFALAWGIGPPAPARRAACWLRSSRSSPTWAPPSSCSHSSWSTWAASAA